MLRLTLMQMRLNVARLVAAGVAIAISAAFVAATLLAGNLIRTATTDEFAAPYARADLVVSLPDYGQLTPKQVDLIRRTPGVTAVAPQSRSYENLRANGRIISQLAVPSTSTASLEPQRVVSGRFPDGPGQVALPTSVAQRLDVRVGDTVRDVRSQDGGSGSTTVTAMRVTGTVSDPYGAYTKEGGAAVMDAGQLTSWLTGGTPTKASTVPVFEDALVATDGDAAVVRAALTGVGLPSDVLVQTRTQAARAETARATDGQDVFTVVVLGFAAIALLVAGLVIANTFQVLVAQRARTLALLRCVGAQRGQVARSVLTEASLLGVGSATVGIGLGAALAQLALAVARPRTTLPLPATVAITPAVVLVPLVAGVLVTVCAALVPARAATRVAPLAALRPDDGPRLRARAGRVRGAFALLAVVGGAGVLALGMALGGSREAELGVAAGFVGGAISFVGILVGAVFWMPAVVNAGGRLLGRTSASSRLAASNTARNPRRTSATATALLIGVTLVVMMATGAACARTTLGSSLDTSYPVDVEVSSAYQDASGTPVALPSGITRDVAQVDGVASVAHVSVSQASLDAHGKKIVMTLEGVDPAAAADVLRDPHALDALGAGTVVIPREVAGERSIAPGDVVTVRANDADGKRGRSVELTARLGDVDPFTAYVTPTALRTIDPAVPVNAAWLRLGDHADPADTVASINDVVAVSKRPVEVHGPATRRASLEHVIDTILAIVLGLLAVAVLIALIGVANTLSLSVIERRRESATLRAIGLTRGQLRWMLAQEGMLIAAVGAVSGIALGVAYGWAGATAALTSTGTMHLVVPWSDLVLVLVVAVVAGLVASVVPGRSAARTPPVAALSVE